MEYSTSITRAPPVAVGINNTPVNAENLGIIGRIIRCFSCICCCSSSCCSPPAPPINNNKEVVAIEISRNSATSSPRSVTTLRNDNAASSPRIEEVDRKLDYSYEMNHKLAALFLGDAHTQNTYLYQVNLEGGSQRDTGCFIRTHLEKALPKQANSNLFENMKRDLDDVIEFWDKLNEIQNKYPTQYKNQEHYRSVIRAEFGEFFHWIKQKIESIPNGKTFVIPGGWYSRDQIGHSQLYVIERQQKDKFMMTVFNSGAGLDYHHEAYFGWKRKSCPTIKETEISIEDLLLEDNWYGYYRLLTRGTFCTSKDVYEGFLKSIHPLFGKKHDITTVLEAEWYTDQRTGRCPVDSWFVFFRSKLTKADYKTFKAAILYQAFAEYQNFLKDLFCKIDKELAANLTAHEIRGRLATLRLLSTYKEEYSESIFKSSDKRLLTTETARKAETFCSEIDVLIRESTKVYEHAFSILSPFTNESLQESVLEIDKPTIEAVQKSDEKEKAENSSLDRLCHWPTEPEKLLEALTSWYDVTQKDFVNATWNTFLFTQELLMRMPSVADPYWDKIPANDREGCLILISNLSEIYLGTRIKSFWVRPTNRYNNVDEICFIQKALAVAKRLTLNLPNDPAGIKNCTINMEWLSHRNTETAINLPIYHPAEERELTETLDFLRSHSSKKEKGMFPRFIDDSGLRFKANEISLKFEQEVKDGNVYEDELCFTYHFLRENQKTGKESDEKTLPERFALAVCDLKGDILPKAFCALKKQAHITQTILQDNFIPTRRFKAKENSTKLSIPASEQPIDTHFIKITSKHSLQPSMITIYPGCNPDMMDWTNNGKDRFKYCSKQPVDKDLCKLFNGIGLFEEQPHNVIALSTSLKRELDAKDEDLVHLLFLINRIDKKHQALKIISYFKRNLDKLQTLDFQIIFLKLMFERGVLSSHVREHPDFVTTLKRFVQNGYQRSKELENIPAALFYLRLGSYFREYCLAAKIDSKLCATFPDIIQESEELLKTVPTAAHETKTLITRELLAAFGRENKLDPQTISRILRHGFLYFEDPIEETHLQHDPALENDIFKLYRAIRLALQNMDDKEFDETLSNAVQPQSTPMLTWNRQNWPQIYSKDYRYHIHMRNGTLSIDGQVKNTLPRDLLNDRDFDILFPDRSALKDISVKRNSTILFTDQHGRKNRITLSPKKTWIYEKEIEQKWHVFGVMIAEFYYSCRYIFDTCSQWYDPTTNCSWFLEHATGKIKYQFNYTSQQLTSEDKEECHYKLRVIFPKNTQDSFTRHFVNFDSETIFWGDNQAIKIIQAPKYGLYFRDTLSVVKPAHYQGYQLAKHQYLPILDRVKGYFILETEDKDPSKPKLLIIPKSKVNSRSVALTLTDPLPLQQEKGLYTYQIDAKGELQSADLEARLFSYYLLLSQRKYGKARKFFSFQAKKVEPYSKEEKSILIEFIKTEDNDPRAMAFKLKAFLLLTCNAELHGNLDEVEKITKEHNIFDTYLAYLDQFSHVSPFPLEEEWILVNLYKDKDHRVLQRYNFLHDLPVGGKTALMPVDKIEITDEDISKAVNKIINCYNFRVLKTEDYENNCLTLESDFISLYFFYFVTMVLREKPNSFPIKRILSQLCWIEASGKEGIRVITQFLRNLIPNQRIAAMDPNITDLENFQKLHPELTSENREEFTKLLTTIFEQWTNVGNVEQDKTYFYLKGFKKRSLTLNAPLPITRMTQYQKLPPIFSNELLFGSSSEKASTSAQITVDIKEKDALVTIAAQSPAATSRAPFFKAIHQPDKEAHSREIANQQKLVDRLTQIQKQQKNRVEGRAISELISEIGVASKAPSTPKWEIDRNVLPQLKENLKTQFEIGKKDLKSQKEALLKNANRSFEQEGLRLLTISGRIKKYTLDDLLPLYHHRDAQTLLPSLHPLNHPQPLFPPNEFQKFGSILYGKIENYLLAATRLQQIQRTREAIEKYESLGKDAHECDLQYASDDILEKLTAERAYSPEQFPALLIFEYKRNILLRKDQIDTMVRFQSNDNVILHIPPGKGKSDVILPLQGEANADGNKLAALMILEELRPEVSKNLTLHSGASFKQEPIRINWTEMSPSSIYNILISIREGRKILFNTDKEMHQFVMRSRIQRRNFICSKQPSKVQQIELAHHRDIKMLLRQYGKLLMDEPDTMFKCTQESHIAIGQKQQVDQRYIDIAAMAYEFLLMDPKMKGKVYFEFCNQNRVKTESSAQPFTASLYNEFKPLLISALSERFIKHCPERKELDATTYEKEIDAYLSAETGQPVELPKQMSDKLKDYVAFLRGMIHVFLPMTLDKIAGQDYGLAPNEKFDPNNPLAIPFHRADSPKLGSQYAHVAAQMGYTIQAYLNEGIRVKLLEKEITRIQNMALQQMSMGNLTSIKLTPAYKEFETLCGEQIAKQHSLSTLKGAAIGKIAKGISTDLTLCFQFILKYVLTTICVYDKRITSNAQHLANIFGITQGFTGTIENHETYHPRITSVPLEGAAGKTLSILWKKITQPVITLKTESRNSFEVLAEMLSYENAKECHAIIDLGALLQGDATQQQLAERALQLRPELSAVVFFDGNNEMILKRGCKDAQHYSEKCDVERNKRLTIYNQKHCRGVNILQDPKAVAIVTVNKNVMRDEFDQALNRMRAMANGQTFIFFLQKELPRIINKSLELQESRAIDGVDLYLFATKNQAKQKAAENLVAIIQKMQFAVFQACDYVLDNVSSSDLNSETYQELDDLLITTIENSPYKDYGTIPDMADARVALRHFKTQTLSKLEHWYQKWEKSQYFEGYSILLDIKKLSAEIDVIIDKALIVGKEQVNQHLPLVSSHLQDASVELTVSASADHSQTQDQNVHQRVAIDQNTNASDYKPEPLDRLAWTKDSLIQAGIFKRALISHLTLSEADEKDGKENHSPSTDTILRKARQNDRYFVTAFDALSMNSKANLAVIAALFKDSTNLRLSINLIFTEKHGMAFGPYQKPFGSCLVVQSKTKENDIQLVSLDGGEAEFFKDALQKDKENPSTAPRDVKMALYHPDAGIYQQGSDAIDVEKLAKSEEFSLLTVQEKLLRGELHNYNGPELTLLQRWAMKSAKLEQVQDFFKTVLLRSIQSAKEYPHSVLATHAFTTIQK